MAGILPDWLQNSGLFGNMSAPQTDPAMPQAQQPQAGGGFFPGLLGYLGDNRSMLMGLGAGIAQGGGIGKGLELGARYSLLDQAQQDKSQTAAVQRANILSTYNSLKASGIPHEQAVAAALNPKILEALAPQVYGKTPEVKLIKDAFGNEVPYQVDAGRGTIKRLSETGGEGGGGGPASNFLAPGIKSVDSNLAGDDYLKQFSPEVQSAVRNYVEGKSLPTGNPRQGFTQNIKMIAQKYGNDVGVPADDASFAARRTMLNDLNKTTPGSAGGQITFARTSIRHLDEVAKAADALGNYDVGLGPLNTAINNVRGLTSEQRAKVTAFQDAVQHYGQEVTKFYAGSPGGVAERDRFLSTLGAAKSPQELAAAIAQERALIPERLSELENRIQGTLGPSASKYPVHSPESQKALESIDTVTSRMKAGQAAIPAPAFSQQDLQAEARRRGLIK